MGAFDTFASAASAFNPFIALGAGAASLVGGIISSGETNKALEERQRRIDRANQDFRSSVGPVIDQLRNQASQDLSGQLNQQDRILQGEFASQLNAEQDRQRSIAQERIARSFAGFGEQNSQRALSAQAEVARTGQQADFMTRLKLALQQRADIENRKRRGITGLGTVANIEAQKAQFATQAAQATPITTSGFGESLGALGGTVLGFEGQLLGNQILGSGLNSGGRTTTTGAGAGAGTQPNPTPFARNLNNAIPPSGFKVGGGFNTPPDQNFAPLVVGRQPSPLRRRIQGDFTNLNRGNA